MSSTCFSRTHGTVRSAKTLIGSNSVSEDLCLCVQCALCVLRVTAEQPACSIISDICIFPWIISPSLWWFVFHQIYGKQYETMHFIFHVFIKDCCFSIRRYSISPSHLTIHESNKRLSFVGGCFKNNFILCNSSSKQSGPKIVYQC